jgi:hypothetical protein
VSGLVVVRRCDKPKPGIWILVSFQINQKPGATEKRSKYLGKKRVLSWRSHSYESDGDVAKGGRSPQLGEECMKVLCFSPVDFSRC